MDKLLEVKEFDRIAQKNKDRSDGKYKYLNKRAFSNLVKLIEEFSSDEENTDALNFMGISRNRIVGQVVTIKNYVGLIQMSNGYKIQILPKISLGDDEDLENKETKRIFIKMLKSMKGFLSKVFNDANLEIGRMNLYEIFINMYLQEVRHLVKSGIKSTYYRQEENLKYYTGKILISQHIKTNMLNKGRFYVAYDKFHPNRAENRLVKATLLKLLHLTKSAKNSKEIRQLLIAFEMVEPSKNYKNEFAQVKIWRNTKDYEILMQWSKVFLLNESFTAFSGKNKSKSLLFPMDRLYENYVSQQLKKMLESKGWIVSIQDNGCYLFEQPESRFALRPDIVCNYGDRTVVMDTKWKRLNKNRLNYGISQGDMYQMYAYSKKYKTNEMWLLYPLSNDLSKDEEIKFESEDGTTVNIYFIDLAHMEDTMIELKNKLESR
ncbi:MAG: McrC family protein [Veillonella sp.]|uniref:McrC family protein n=1 Tax=Veillonella sp. TaxID=1926307 RepID=UPI0025F2CD3B|nr:McrC family protein [Veillonella sp.]MBS4913468.1 McrC family protein [Veillonella sp.]